MLSRSATFDKLSCDPINCADTHAPLSVSSESVLPGECVAAETWIGFGASMNLGVPFEIVAAHESFVAVIALELPIVEVSLDVRFDVLLPAKSLIAIVEFANPLVVRRIRPIDVLCNVIQGNIGLLNGGANTWIKVEV
jgi:hypothetical protein